MKRYTLLHLAVGATLVGLGATSLVSAAPLDSAVRADSLLSVDQNRAEIVEGLVAKWKEHLASGKEKDLKQTLMGLRADKLLAVSLAQDQKQFAALLEKDDFLPLKEGSARGVQAKALGESGKDIVYTPVTPCRILDTRLPSPNPIAAGGQRDFVGTTSTNFGSQGGLATGNCGVPTSAVAIQANIVAILPDAAGFLTVWPFGQTRPLASTLNFPANDIRANAVTIPLTKGQSSEFSVFALQTANVLVDVLGYFAPPSTGNGLRVVQSTDANFGTSPNTINGVVQNSVSKNCPSGLPGQACQLAFDDVVVGGTIGGGGRSDQPNKVTDSFGTVGGGINNRAGNDDGAPEDASYATVAGGASNLAIGNSSTVGGGFDNQALAGSTTVGGGANNRALADGSTVSGGRVNVANGERSVIAGGGGNSVTVGAFAAVVSGGFENQAQGAYSTVSGGLFNFARGELSWAGGRRADANFDGSFVWADRNDFTFASLGANAFNVRSTGGARIVTAINASGTATAGVSLLAGDSSWNVISDRAAKDNWTPVNAKAILSKLAKLPLASWNYKAQDASVKHIGPSAQDFRAAFGLGHGDKTIATVDADGVALAAIQGLHQVMKEKDTKIGKLERELQAIKKKLGL